MTDQDLILIIGNLQGTMNSVKEQVGSIDSKVDALPCVNHSDALKNLETWQKSCTNGKKMIETEKMKGSISLKNAVIGIILTAVLSIGITLATKFVFLMESIWR